MGTWRPDLQTVGYSRRNPDIADSGQEGSYNSDREDMKHPEEDQHVRMAQRS